MLSISQPIHSAEYYLSLASEDYFFEGGEPRGLWRGEGAPAFGLKGMVEKEALRSLFSGKSPDGRHELVQNAGSGSRQSGWDLTFSAPKSVSVFWSQAPPDIRRLVQKSQQAAVDAALNYLESSAAFTRRGKGGRQIESAKVVFATFEHGTSRAQDPQLHTHALLLNLTVRADGTTGSIVSKEFFRQKMVAGALYRTELAYQLRQKIGLRVKSTDHGFEIIGVPQKLCGHFSKRRKEVEVELARRNLKSAVAAKIAAVETRQAKENIPREKLFEVWQNEGRRFGWGTIQARDLVCQHKREPEKIFPQDIRKLLLSENPESQTQAKLMRFACRLSQEQGLSAKEALHAMFSCFETKGSIEVRFKRLFWKAPAWSPLRKLKLPYLAFPWQKPVRRFGATIARIDTPVGTLSLRKKLLFPKAPKWSPARKLSFPVLCISEPSPKPWSKQERAHRITH